MSLSPFDSFQSRFVTYLLNRPRISVYITISNFVGKKTETVSILVRISTVLRRMC